PLWSCRALRSHSKTATPWRTQPSREHTEANVRAQGAPVLPHLNRRRRDGGGRFVSVAAGSARHSVPARGRACAPAGHEGGPGKRESLVGWPPGWKPAASSFTATGGKIVVVAAQERAPSHLGSHVLIDPQVLGLVPIVGHKAALSALGSPGDLVVL